MSVVAVLCGINDSLCNRRARVMDYNQSITNTITNPLLLLLTFFQSITNTITQ